MSIQVSEKNKSLQLSGGELASSAETQQTWHPGMLGSKLALDAASAATAAGLVAPMITVIDKAAAERVSGRTSFANSLRCSLRQLFLRPHTFFTSRPFAIMFLLYGSTFLTANTTDTLISTANHEPPSTTSSGFAKFATVSSVNLTLALYKDSQYTKMFGTIAPRPLPPISYVLLSMRDCMTIFASFNLPSRMAPRLPEGIESTFNRLSVAQFAAPALMQLCNSPLHLLGLDLYNRNQRTPFRERLRVVRRDWPAISMARMCRVIPAFGIGGVVNAKTRKRLMQRLE